MCRYSALQRESEIQGEIPEHSESVDYLDLHGAMSLSKNDLGITSIDELVSWTSSYVHFKQALEVVTWTPDQAVSYLNAFPDFRERFAKELTKQGHLEARLPKAMRDKIAADKPNFEFIKTVLFRSKENPDC